MSDDEQIAEIDRQLDILFDRNRYLPPASRIPSPRAASGYYREYYRRRKEQDPDWYRARQEYSRKWAQEHPEQVAARHRAYRERKRAEAKEMKESGL